MRVIHNIHALRRPIIAVAAAASLLLISLAALWHHHDDGDDDCDHGQATCSICLTAAAPQADTTSVVPDLTPSGLVVEFLVLEHGRDGSIEPTGPALARGPPATPPTEACRRS